jgi:hypothetical protein
MTTADDLWGPIDLSQWRSVPFVSGRVATEDDVRAGRAVFHVKGTSEAISVEGGLPALALHTGGAGVVSPVILIQLERAADREIAGIRFLLGGNTVCTLSDLRLADEDAVRQLL